MQATNQYGAVFMRFLDPFLLSDGFMLPRRSNECYQCYLVISVGSLQAITSSVMVTKGF